MSRPNTYDQTVASLMRLTCPTGEIGLEIEVEGRKLPGCVDENGNPFGTLPKAWKVVPDNSLRNMNPGDVSCEYVLREPKSRKDFSSALEALDKALANAEADAYPTYRTSVHVHLNVADWPLRRLWSLLTTYFILEDVLVNFADGGTGYRAGNRFCLRASDSETLIDRLHMIGRNDFTDLRFPREEWKYGAVNLYATKAYGSLEFRSLRGTTDFKLIQKWVDMLLACKDYAAKFDDPREIITQVSELTAMVWAERVLGKETIKELLDFSPNMDQMLVFGLRNAQDVAYSCDWKPYVAPEVHREEPAETTFRIRYTSTTNYGVRITAAA